MGAISTEWRKKNMQQIAALVQELKRQKETRKDIVIDSRLIQAQGVKDESIRFQVGDVGTFGATKWAHGQIAQKCNIPQAYYNRMLEAKEYSLLAHNVNTWMPTREARLVRILDGNVRALLSDRYRLLDNYDLLFLALDEFVKAGAEIYRADLTETHLYVKAVTPKVQAEVHPGDIIQSGLILKNSEVGASRFAVLPFVLRLRCMNGLTFGEEGYSKVHLGQRREQGEILNIWSSETLELENRAVWSAVRDVIRNTFDPASFEAIVQRLRNTSEVPIRAPVQAIDNVVEHLGLTEARKDEILNHFLADKDFSQYGLVQAITRTARDIKDPDEQVDLETKASSILAMTPERLAKEIDKADIKANGGNHSLHEYRE